MVYKLNETTWLQDVGGGAEIFYFLNWAMLTIDNRVFSPQKRLASRLRVLDAYTGFHSLALLGRHVSQHAA